MEIDCQEWEGEKVDGLEEMERKLVIVDKFVELWISVLVV